MASILTSPKMTRVIYLELAPSIVVYRFSLTCAVPRCDKGAIFTPVQVVFGSDPCTCSVRPLSFNQLVLILNSSIGVNVNRSTN